MDWEDEGVVLRLIKHGENAVILEVLARRHGRHRGYVHGGLGKRRRGLVQPGNVLRLGWRARLADNLGNFTIEAKTSYAAAIMNMSGPLMALRAVTGMLSRSLPERDPHVRLYDGLIALLDVLAAAEEDDPAWGVAVVRFERDLLAELGYGLDLGKCVVTGEREGLAYVSPRTGRAVTEAGAGEYRDRLLVLPVFLTADAPAPWRDVAAGLALTGHFLDRFFVESDGAGLTEERRRLADSIHEKSSRYGGAQEH